MKFIDEAVIRCPSPEKAATVRRVVPQGKVCPQGWPGGGDGGRGGSVFAIADRNINTLVDYRFARIHRAKDGKRGSGALIATGSERRRRALRMPVGTVIADFRKLVETDRRPFGAISKPPSLAKGGEADSAIYISNPAPIAHPGS